MSDFSNDEIEETYVASQTEQIANLNQAMISMRAEIVLKDKKLKDLDKKKEALDLALERVSGVDKVVSRLQKEVAYYEENLELVWKRRIRPAKLIEGKANFVEQDKIPRRIVNPAIDLQNMKKVYEVETEKYESKIKNLQKHIKKLQDELNSLKEDNENMPIPQHIQQMLTDKINNYETRLAKAEKDKTFYMNLCYNSKDIDNSIIINKETEESPRKGLGEVLNAK